MVSMAIAFVTNRNNDKRKAVIEKKNESKRIIEQLDSIAKVSEQEVVKAIEVNKVLLEVIDSFEEGKKITLEGGKEMDSVFVSLEERECLRDSLMVKFRL